MASLYVSKYSGGWRVIEEFYDKDSTGKTCRKHRTVPRLSYPALGIDPDWTAEQAREGIKLLNKQNNIQRKEQRKIIGAAERFKNLRAVDAAFLPADLVKEFDERIEQDSFGSVAHIKRLHSHWDFVVGMIKVIKLAPHQFFDRKRLIYRYFVEKGISPDYANKLLRMLNSWGYFYAGNLSALFRPVPVPRGVEREALAKAYRLKPNSRKPSNPITPSDLASKKSKLYPAHYHWLFISVWFGLRPEEIDNLNPNTFTISRQKDKHVLHVYQSKLVTLPENDRWKLIPCLYPEQEEALELIKSGEFKRPQLKVVKEHFGKATGLYCGRKGFELLMREKGHTIEQIAAWLGHQSIETTWEKYRNRRVASF